MVQDQPTPTVCVYNFTTIVGNFQFGHVQTQTKYLFDADNKITINLREAFKKKSLEFFLTSFQSYYQ